MDASARWFHLERLRRRPGTSAGFFDLGVHPDVCCRGPRWEVGPCERPSPCEHSLDDQTGGEKEVKVSVGLVYSPVRDLHDKVVG